MSGDNEFRGAVPLGPKGQATVPLVSCIWHKYEATAPHPPDAPKCWEQDGQYVLNMAGLISWLTVNLTQLLGIVNAMAQQLAEVSVYIEALDSRGDDPETDEALED